MMHRDTQPPASPTTLSIGGATFDVFVTIDGIPVQPINEKDAFVLPLGGKLNIRNAIGACGGGAHNTSVGLARLGCEAAFSGVVGDDQWGQAICKNMEQEGVNTSLLTVIEHEASSFSVILMSEKGERTILTHKGMDRHFHDVTFDREAARNMDAIILNRIHEHTSAIEDDLLSLLTAAPHTHFTWNPGGHQIQEGIRKPYNHQLVERANLLLLNAEEALAFSGKRTVREALHTLSTIGATVVCVTDGPRGCIATDGTMLYRCPALPCTVVDTTGAGDAFCTACTWALVTGKDLPTALKAGTINAMSVVGQVGAQAGLLTETQIQTQLAATDLSVSTEKC